MTIALCINFIGDGLRDAFDPRQNSGPPVSASTEAGRDTATEPDEDVLLEVRRPAT